MGLSSDSEDDQGGTDLQIVPSLASINIAQICEPAVFDIDDLLANDMGTVVAEAVEEGQVGRGDEGPAQVAPVPVEAGCASLPAIKNAAAHRLISESVSQMSECGAVTAERILLPTTNRSKRQATELSTKASGGFALQRTPTKACSGQRPRLKQLE